MLRFLIFVTSGVLVGGLFYGFAAAMLAQAINHWIPFGLDHFIGTPALDMFLSACIASTAVLSLVASVRTGRRMHFGAMDGRPALLGNLGHGRHAARGYARRAVAALLVAASALVTALGSAMVRTRVLEGGDFPALVVYACLVCTLGLVAAIELNDLWRTARLHG